MSTPPDVSFVVAAFNAAGTIERALRSALGSRGVSLEIVVADDCSPDDTVARVEALGDPRIRLVRLAENGGPGLARNAAMHAATGRYLAVLDADDEVKPDRLRRLVARLDETGAAAIVDNIEHAAAGAGAAPMFSAEELASLDGLSLRDFIRGNRLFAGGFNFGYFKPVVRRAFAAEHAIAYPRGIRIGEDYLFLAALLAAGGRCLVDGVVGYTYHITGGSISRVLSLAHVERMIEADREFLQSRALTREERAAQAARTRSLADATSFLSMVEAIKEMAPLRLLSHAARNPRSIRHFRMPVAARFLRLFARNEAMSTRPDRLPAARSPQIERGNSS